MELICKVQHYDWGSRDPMCNVYTLAKLNDPEKEGVVTAGQLEKPYAELWVGTHTSGPAVIKENGQLLSDYITINPESLGEKVVAKFGVELPFLLKILSVNKPLSIQAHPSKVHAEELHQQFPNIYKDSNHKPEMIYTLTNFKMLRGFRAVSEIKLFLQAVPELRSILGVEVMELLASCSEDQEVEALRVAYRKLMTSPADIVKVALDSILAKTQAMDEASRGSCLADLLESLHSHFPGDVGCLSLYFLQDFDMAPGEVAFLPANQIHAYISGECVEIMACSDNVVRGGLTPKLVDVETLCGMLQYEPATASSNLDVIKYADNCIKYVPHNIKDFSLMHVVMELGFPSIYLPISTEASVLLALGPASFTLDDGPVAELCRGQVLFLRANQKIQLSPSNKPGSSSIFIAMCNV